MAWYLPEFKFRSKVVYTLKLEAQKFLSLEKEQVIAFLL